MKNSELLTQDEIEALREGLANHNAEGPGQPQEAEGILPYELISPENALSGILPVLETIHERFVHQLRASLIELLRREMEVVASPLEMRPHNDFITSLSIPCSVNIIGISPLNGLGILVLEQQLVLVLVDTFFGGTGRPYTPPRRAQDFTATETRFIQRLLNMAFHSLEAAWHPFVPVKFTSLSTESNPHFITEINPTETLVVTRAQIELDSVVGTLHLALPYALFKSMRNSLLSGFSKRPRRGHDPVTRLLEESLKESRVNVRALLAEADLALGEILSLRVGDFIPLEIPSQAILEAEGVSLYSGQYGIAQGWRALKIDQTLTSLEGEETCPEEPNQ
jgi:flagellar motor switch protein FliM